MASPDRLGRATGTETVGGPRSYGKIRTLALTRRRTGGTSVYTGLYTIGVSYGRIGNTLTPRTTRTIAREVPLITPPVLAANDSGDAVAAWVTYEGPFGSRRLYVSQRHKGGRFGRPTMIVGSGFFVNTPLAVAVSRGGDIVVAFVGQHKLGGEPRVVARVRRHGHAFGSLEDLGVGDSVGRIVAAMGAAGRTIVAWQTLDFNEVVGAVRPSGPRHFRATAALDRGNAIRGVVGAIAVAAAQDGTATVAWTQRRGPASAPRFGVRFATVGVNARFAPSQELPGAEGAVRDVAVARDGTTVVAWSAAVGKQGSDGPLMAATHPLTRGPGTTFAPAELVSAPDDRTEGAALAFGPAGSEPAAAWLSRGAAA